MPWTDTLGAELHEPEENAQLYDTTALLNIVSINSVSIGKIFNSGSRMSRNQHHCQSIIEDALPEVI